MCDDVKKTEIYAFRKWQWNFLIFFKIEFFSSLFASCRIVKNSFFFLYFYVITKKLIVILFPKEHRKICSKKIQLSTRYNYDKWYKKWCGKSQKLNEKLLLQFSRRLLSNFFLCDSWLKKMERKLWRKWKHKQAEKLIKLN